MNTLSSRLLALDGPHHVWSIARLNTDVVVVVVVVVVVGGGCGGSLFSDAMRSAKGPNA